jgi:hypothetical protein
MIRVGVTGAAGRMGRTLIRAIHDAEDMTLGAAFERSGDCLCWVLMPVSWQAWVPWVCPSRMTLPQRPTHSTR